MINKIPVKNQDVVKAELDQKIVLMSLENSAYYALDHVGSAIWELIDNTSPLSKVLDTLLEQYEVDRETCQRDVLDFVEDMVRKRILILKEEQ